MNIFVKTLSIFLLLFNGMGAFYGSYHLISDPSGESLQLPLSFLEKSPFQNYLIPGIVLLLVNGVFSFVGIATLLMKNRSAGLWVAMQGILLTGWIVIQLLMIQIFYPIMHVTFLSMGLILTLCGIWLQKQKSEW